MIFTAIEPDKKIFSTTRKKYEVDDFFKTDTEVYGDAQTLNRKAGKFTLNVFFFIKFSKKDRTEIIGRNIIFKKDIVLKQNLERVVLKKE